MQNQQRLRTPEAYASIVDIVRERARVTPNVVALTFLKDGELDAESWTYAGLWAAVSRAAACLAERGVAGKRVLLLYASGLEYVAAFLGTLAAGATAVPAYPPLSRRVSERVTGIVEDCAPALILCDQAQLENASTRRFLAAAGDYVCTEALGPQTFTPPTLRATDLAMLQYTSGSTADPKGVMLTHGNILANCRAVHAWLGPDPDRRGLVWLPPYHDMGLLGGVLQPLHDGFPLFFMSPHHFVQRPSRWLAAIDRYRITLSGGPNFGYGLCAEISDSSELQRFDLSCWRQAFCGAEPVRSATMQAFVDRFAAHGFQPSAIMPCYGLAEATLFVTGRTPSSRPLHVECLRDQLKEGTVEVVSSKSPPEEAALQQVVGNGRPVRHCRVEIVDVESRERLPEGQLGEIWVASPGVAQGYWQAEAASRATFSAHTASGEGPFLRTGDLGFLREGELFVTGRHKDLVIVAGKNHHPEDIENSVENADDAVYPSGSVAFSVEEDGGEEVLVIMAEARVTQGNQREAEIAENIKRRVTGTHGISPAQVILCRRGSIPRTTSGKIRRSASRASYLARMSKTRQPSSAAPRSVGAVD